MKRPVIAVACFALIALTSGCVTGHRILTLQVPKADSYPASNSSGPIAVGAISDERTFQNKPPEPSTPSIDGDVTTLTPQQKAMYIGRQRNTYGHAMGDIMLPEQESVPLQMSALLEEALKRRGYTIAQGTATADNQVTAKIEQFWAWGTPGAFVLTFESDLRCMVTITHGGRTASFEVHGSSKTHGQVGKDGNWLEAYQEGYEDFLKDLDRQLTKSGF